MKSVHLAGEFNGWNTTQWKMEAQDDNKHWAINTLLYPGMYSYKFVITTNSGKTYWIPEQNEVEKEKNLACVIPREKDNKPLGVFSYLSNKDISNEIEHRIFINNIQTTPNCNIRVSAVEPKLCHVTRAIDGGLENIEYKYKSGNNWFPPGANGISNLRLTVAATKNYHEQTVLPTEFLHFCYRKPFPSFSQTTDSSNSTGNGVPLCRPK